MWKSPDCIYVARAYSSSLGAKSNVSWKAEQNQMPIELTDIEEDDDIAPEPARSRVGCLIMDDDGGWTAVCPGLDHRSEGQGPFDSLPTEALWLINRDYKTVRPLQDAHRDAKLKLSGWMRVALEDMPREWGIDDITAPANAEAAASILDRVLKMSFETARKSAASTLRQDADIHASIERSPSLATGLRNLFNSEMESSVPEDAKVRKRIAEALGYGVSRLEEFTVREGEFMLHCRVPRLSHALRVTAHEVPSAGKWQKASIPEGEPLDDKIADLRALGKPVMVVANVKERPGMSHEYFSSWVRPNNKAIRRISYTLDEVVALLPWFTFEDYSIIVGPGWRKSVTGRMVSSLIDVAGGRDVASSSWSVNAAAENVLCGGFRKLSGSENLSPECVWLTAWDRMEMINPIQSLMDCGATLVSAYAGGLTVKVPEDPEMIAMAVNAVWEAGLHLPIGTVRQLMGMGIEPPFDPTAYGGAPEDLILGQISNRGQRNAMWRLDEIMDEHMDSRAATFAAILG